MDSTGTTAILVLAGLYLLYKFFNNKVVQQSLGTLEAGAKELNSKTESAVRQSANSRKLDDLKHNEKVISKITKIKNGGKLATNQSVKDAFKDIWDETV